MDRDLTAGGLCWVHMPFVKCSTVRHVLQYIYAFCFTFTGSELNYWPLDVFKNVLKRPIVHYFSLVKKILSYFFKKMLTPVMLDGSSHSWNIVHLIVFVNGGHFLITIILLFCMFHFRWLNSIPKTTALL